MNYNLECCMQRKRNTERFITEIQKILKEKICDPQLNVNCLARLLCVSTQRVYQLMYSYYRENPKKIIESFRLARAIDLIEQNPAINLSLVASLSGFINYNTFSRCIKRRLHVSPSQYNTLPREYRLSIKLTLSVPHVTMVTPIRPEMGNLPLGAYRPLTLMNKRLQETG